MAVFLAHRKVAEKITEEEYQRFLDGEVPAMKENGKTYFLEDLFGEDVSDVETFLSDIDGDGVKELHIRTDSKLACSSLGKTGCNGKS